MNVTMIGDTACVEDAANEIGRLTKPMVYVVDDDPDIRKSLHFVLGTSNIDVWPFAAAEDFFDQLPTLAPGPILLDIRMPSMDGIEMLELLKARGTKWPVVVMTAHGDIPIAVKAMKLGAIELLEKPFTAALLDEALALAFGLLVETTRDEIALEDARARLRKLSFRESEVVACLVEGLPNKAIAYRLGLSARTIEMHRRNALAKLGLKSVAETVALVVSANAGAPQLQRA